MFINGHERLDIVKDYKAFLKKMKELKLYIIEFNENDAMKPKIYLLNCTIRVNN